MSTNGMFISSEEVVLHESAQRRLEDDNYYAQTEEEAAQRRLEDDNYCAQTEVEAAQRRLEDAEMIQKIRDDLYIN